MARSRLEQGAELLDLPFTDQRRGIGRGDLLRQAADDVRARGIGQSGELVEMFGDVLRVVATLAGRANQHGALDRWAR